MREFTTAVKNITDHSEWIEFKVDGRLCRAQREPGDGQIAFLMSYNTKHVKSADKIAAVLNFFDSTLDDDTQQYLVARMLDKSDAFGMEEVNDILMGLMEEWSGRPTNRLSGSGQSQPSTGSSSTEVVPGSISSTSPSTDS